MKKKILGCLIILVVGVVVGSLVMIRDEHCMGVGKYVGMIKYEKAEELMKQPDPQIKFIESEKRKCIERTSLGEAFLSLVAD